MTAPTKETYPTDTPHGKDEERWTAVLRRDPTFDEAFVYAVRTTGIYCRPTCPARRPLRNHVEFHPTAAAAVQAGFRPCHRCRPDTPSPIAQRTALIARLCRQIESAGSPLSLQALAQQAGMSPSHLHRQFKSIVGVTPKAYASAHRAKQLRSSLSTAPSVTAAIHDTGYGSHSAFYADAPRALGMTPSRYRRGGREETIHYAFGDCWLGCVLVAATLKGICAILLGERRDRLLVELQDRFPHARLDGTDAALRQRLANVTRLLEQPEQSHGLDLDIRGTAFQRLVWQALTEVPVGSTISYAQLARRIGAPKAVRAVGSACAANAIAVAIPCHRAVRSDGSLSSYRWGVERKRALLMKESHACDESTAAPLRDGESSSNGAAAATAGQGQSSRRESERRSLHASRETDHAAKDRRRRPA